MFTPSGGFRDSDHPVWSSLHRRSSAFYRRSGPHGAEQSDGDGTRLLARGLHEIGAEGVSFFGQGNEKNKTLRRGQLVKSDIWAKDESYWTYKIKNKKTFKNLFSLLNHIEPGSGTNPTQTNGSVLLAWSPLPLQTLRRRLNKTSLCPKPNNSENWSTEQHAGRFD